VASAGVMGRECAMSWGAESCVVDSGVGPGAEAGSASSAGATACGCGLSTFDASSIMKSGWSVTNESNSEKSGVGIEASLMVSWGLGLLKRVGQRRKRGQVVVRVRIGRG
jgi:hypothetical protein